MNSRKEFRCLTVTISKAQLDDEKMETAHTYLANFSRRAAPEDSWGTLSNFWLTKDDKAFFNFHILPVHIK